MKTHQTDPTMSARGMINIGAGTHDDSGPMAAINQSNIFDAIDSQDAAGHIGGG